MASAGGLKGMAKGRSDIYRVDPRELHIKKGWNGRDFDDPENKAHVEMLANSIAAVGVKEPLTVTWESNRPTVVNGECRLRATMLAISRGIDIKTIPVQTEDRFANDADRLFSQIVRNSGKPFSQMEQAKVFKRLLDLGWQQSDIASKSGVSPSRVSQVLGLLMLPEPIKAMVSTGQVSAAMAQRTVATTQTPQEAVKVLNEAVTTAKAEGKTRASPKHLNGGNKDDGEIAIINNAIDADDKTDDKTDDKHHRSATEKLVFDVLFDADVDDQRADDKNNPVVLITVSAKNWERLRKALKL